MNIENYHVDSPYPKISGLSPNNKQAKLLMEGYSGQTSELSTVTQYAFHKIKCMRNKEIYDTLQGIFLVETHHLELLGNCINMLGVEPYYKMSIIHKSISWQADVINYENTIKEMILTDIEGEKQAVKYYEETANIIGNEKIRVLLLRLAEDEKLHVKIFTDLYNRYFM